MTATDVIQKFKTAYPGKNIIALPQDNPTEIICEIDPTSEHPDVNIAIAAIISSAPHYHLKATEVYEILQGDLELTVDGAKIALHKGDSYTIKPKQIHSATGNFTLVRVTSRPGWTVEDHVLVPTTHLFRVFTDAKGNYGDAASVVIDEGKHIPDAERQAIARKLATGETAFVNDLAGAKVSIVHPQGEIGFAGVAVLGTAWLLGKLRGEPVHAMHTRDGEVKVWQDGELTWARASLAIMPPWNYKQLESVEAVERITLKETETLEHTMMWAWIDESKGLIRARTFASDWELPEAQGNGSGSMVLAAKLERDIEIKHGEGAVIFAKPSPDGCGDIGGRVAEEEAMRL